MYSNVSGIACTKVIYMYILYNEASCILNKKAIFHYRYMENNENIYSYPIAQGKISFTHLRNQKAEDFKSFSISFVIYAVLF